MPLRDLPDEPSIHTVVVEMPPPATLAQPEKRAVFQPDWIDARILPSLDPCLARFSEDVSRRAVVRIGTVEVEPRLTPILNLKQDVAAVRRPADIDDEEIRVLLCVDPTPGAVCGREDAE